MCASTGSGKLMAASTGSCSEGVVEAVPVVEGLTRVGLQQWSVVLVTGYKVAHMTIRLYYILHMHTHACTNLGH